MIIFSIKHSPVLLVAAAAIIVSAQAVLSVPFAYNTAGHLKAHIISETLRNGVIVQDVSYDSPRGGILRAELISKVNVREKRPAVIFVHWLGDPKTTNHTEFYRDAVALAGKGCVSLLIDAMWATPDWYTKIRSPATDYGNSVKQVVDLRRSLDFLMQQPMVDRKRVAYVGHDFGAMYGAVLSGIDPRPRWYVLMAGNSSFSEWYLLFPHLAQPTNKEVYLRQMAQIDPGVYLRKSKASGILFQFALNDSYIPLDHAKALVKAVRIPHRVVFYKSQHSLQVLAAYKDRIAWLEQQFGLSH